MKVATKVGPFDNCPKCNTRGSIEIYNIYNKPLGYHRMLMMHDSKNKLQMRFKEFKCIKCGAVYNITWMNGFPYPMISDGMKKVFMKRLKSNNS